MKAPGAEPAKWDLSPRTQTVEEEIQTPEICPVTSTHVPWSTCMCVSLHNVFETPLTVPMRSQGRHWVSYIVLHLGQCSPKLDIPGQRVECRSPPSAHPETSGEREGECQLPPLPIRLPWRLLVESSGCREMVTHYVQQTCLGAGFLVSLSYPSHSPMKCVPSRTEAWPRPHQYQTEMPGSTARVSECVGYFRQGR